MDAFEIVEIVNRMKVEHPGRPTAPMLIGTAMRLVLDDRFRPFVGDEEYRFLSDVATSRAVLMQFSRMQQRDHERVADEVLTAVLSVHISHVDVWDWLASHRDGLSESFREKWSADELRKEANHRRGHVEEMQRLNATARTFFLPLNWYQELENTFLTAFMAVLGDERYEAYRREVNQTIADVVSISTMKDLPGSPTLN